MHDYEKLYHLLFNAATDALEALNAQEWAVARKTLIEAQRAAEDLYIGGD